MSSSLENLLFHPPPRITLKLKMPKVSLGNGKTSSKSGNGPLCPDNSGNVYDTSEGGIGQGKPQLHLGRARIEERANGLLPASIYIRRDGGTPPLAIKQSGKPLALHAALHGQSSNGKSKIEPERTRPLKSNGIMDKPVLQRDTSCQTPTEKDTCNKISGKGQSGGFHKTSLEHFSRSLKEATVSLVRTEDLRAFEKNARKTSAFSKPVSNEQPLGGSRACQESDGYCPDAELSDSESEAKGKCRKGGRGQNQRGPAGDYVKSASRAKLSFGSRTSVQR